MDPPANTPAVSLQEFTQKLGDYLRGSGIDAIVEHEISPEGFIIMALRCKISLMPDGRAACGVHGLWIMELILYNNIMPVGELADIILTKGIRAAFPRLIADGIEFDSDRYTKEVLDIIYGPPQESGPLASKTLASK